MTKALTREELLAHAAARPRSVPLTNQRERLNYLAGAVLRAHPRVYLYFGTEHRNWRLRTFLLPWRWRSPMRGTAMALAAADPVLRAAGLRRGTYGAGQDFFGLSDGEMHSLFCYCGYGHATSVPGHEIATRVARFAEHYAF